MSGDQRGPVDIHLDQLFDGLAGTGAAGRRALAEAEDHLRTIEEEGIAAGLAPDEAGRVAVRRFGPVDAATYGLRVVRRRRQVLSALSGAWLVAGLAAVGLGVTYLVAALDLPFFAAARPSGFTVYMVGAGQVDLFSEVQTHPRDTLFRAVLTLLVGAALLAARVIVARRSGLPPTAGQFPAFAAGLFVLAAAVFVVWPPTNRLLALWEGPGTSIISISACVALAIALGLTIWGLLRSRRTASGLPTVR